MDTQANYDDLTDLRQRAVNAQNRKQFMLGLAAFFAVMALFALYLWFNGDSASGFTQVLTTFAGPDDPISYSPVQHALNNFQGQANGPLVSVIIWILALATIVLLAFKEHKALLFAALAVFYVGPMFIASITADITESRRQPATNTAEFFLIELAKENRIDDLAEAAPIVLPKAQAKYVLAQIEYVRGYAPGVRSQLDELFLSDFNHWQPDWGRFHAMETMAYGGARMPKSREYGANVEQSRTFALRQAITIGIGAMIFLGLAWKATLRTVDLKRAIAEIESQLKINAPIEPPAGQYPNPPASVGDPNGVPAWKRPRSSFARNRSGATSVGGDGSAMVTGVLAGSMVSASGHCSVGHDSGSCGGGGGDGGGDGGGGGD